MAIEPSAGEADGIFRSPLPAVPSCDGCPSAPLGGAALDVFENEPLTQASGAKFDGLANLILTPHIAGVTVESNVRVSHMIAGLVKAHLEKADG